MKLGLKKSVKEAVEASDGALRVIHPALFNELNNIAYGTKLTSILELQKFLKENNIIGDIDLAFVKKNSFGRADLAESYYYI